ncbi:MAG: hypothetical protein HGA33_04375 [Candidatus Moranbacteria bacterium]|nr:hypothetical protein [Candidatus Moranbacteria bacterium]
MNFDQPKTDPKNVEKPSEYIPEEVLSMYRVPGYEDEYTEHSLERYRRNSVKLEKDLELIRVFSLNKSEEFSKIPKEVVSIALLMFHGEQLVNFIRYGLTCDDSVTKHSCAHAIRLLSNFDAAPELIRICQRSDDSVVRLEGAKSIKYITIIDRASLIREYFASLSFSETVWDDGDLNRAKVLEKQNIFTSDLEIFLECAENISKAEPNEQRNLKESVMFFIDKGFAVNDFDTKLTCARAIRYLDRKDVAFYVIKGLKSGDRAVMLESASMVGLADASNQEVVYQECVLTGVHDVIEECEKSLRKAGGITDASVDSREKVGLSEPVSLSSLYRDVEEGFMRRDFQKSGSGLTLLGRYSSNDFKGRVIIRHVEFRHFLAWKRLYDDYFFWKKNGFEYVPIEPIISFSIKNDCMTDVYTGVLDTSLEDWLKTSTEWNDELIKQKRKIKRALREYGYWHGHEHDGNFCVRFARDHEGKVDRVKMPRLYLIDFDEAEFADNNERYSLSVTKKFKR